MTDSKKIYWLGVSFDPDEDISDMPYLAEQNHAIDRFLHYDHCALTVSSQKGNIHTETYRRADLLEGADIIDVWFENKARIGFGMVVQDTRVARIVEPVVTEWLRTLGVSVYVGAYEFDTSDLQQKKPRPTGVDEMLSLDLI